MRRLTGDEAELTAELIEALFSELHQLRGIVEGAGLEAPEQIHDATVRVMILNMLDAATEGDLKGSALLDTPELSDRDAWEWLTADQLVKAINLGMSALVRDLHTLRYRPGENGGRELDVQRFRMAWETLAARQLRGEGATVVVEDGSGGAVNLRVLFEPPALNPFKPGNSEEQLTGAQVMVGNMLAYAFKKGSGE
jgi:hypothetical protein